MDAFSRLTGDAFATRATVLILPAGVSEANGLVMSSVGRLVLGISAPCDACTPTSADAAAVVSFLPDGSDLRVEASGIRAPVGLAYYPGTDDLFVTMNQRDDLGDATPGDWLAVVRSGQAWGFPAWSMGSSALVAEWATATVLRVSLTHDGATYAGVAQPFLTGLSKPVPVVTAPDGAVFVGDWATGTIYRIASL